MKIIAVAAIKGGCGKTTTAAAIAQAAAYDGKKVLAIDIDPQANFTFSLGADQNKPGAYQLLNGAAAEDLIQRTEQGLDVISASPDLATLKTSRGSATRLQNALKPTRDSYDIIVTDTPPMFSENLYNALQAATTVIIPLVAESYSLQGLYQITDIIHQMQNSNQALTIAGAVLTRYDSRPNFNRFMRDTIQAKGQEIGSPLLGVIRQGVSVPEAQALQQSLFEYAPKSNPAIDYWNLYKQIMED